MLKKESIFKKNLLFLALSVLLIIFSLQRMLFFSSGKLESFVSHFVYPIVVVQGKFSNLINSYFQKKKSIEELRKIIELLEKEKEDLMFDNFRLKASISYLEKIAEHLEFQKRFNNNSFITSQIINKQISDIGHYCFIDKGSLAGISKDMVAIYKNCLIGKVIEVYPSYSKIVYITDKSCKVAAYCFKTGAVGIYTGSNDLNISKLEYVNHLNNVIENDLVLSNGEGLIYPEGFALGKITKFVKNQIQYDISLEPIIDINKIQYCQLIKK